MNCDLYITPYTKINEGIIDLNVKPRLINLLEESIREYLHDLRVGKNFLEVTKSTHNKRKNLMNGFHQSYTLFIKKYH